MERKESLTEALDRLTVELQTLHEVIEEFRVCFEWAVNNNRLIGPCLDDDPEMRATEEELRELMVRTVNAMVEIRRRTGQQP